METDATDQTKHLQKMKYPSFCLNKKTKETRPEGKARTIRTWLQGSRGMLSARIYMPAMKEGQKCPAVVVMHGIMTTKDIYPQPAIAKMLQARGIMAVTFDFNGHGCSYGSFTDMTIPKEKEDALKVIGYVSSLPFVSRTGLCGHSQGGVVSVLCAGELRERISAAVLMAPAAVCKDDALNGNIMGGVFDPANPPEVLKVMMHRLGGNYIRTAQQLDIYGQASLYKGPLCVIHGEKDKTVPARYGKQFKSVCPQCELHLLPEEGHLLNGDRTGVCSIACDFLAKALGTER